MLSLQHLLVGFKSAELVECVVRLVQGGASLVELWCP